MRSGAMTTGARRSTVLSALESIAPLGLAEDWDNVGLLVDPGPPRRIRTVMLAVDCTDAVVEEAVRSRAELIVAYHPVLFQATRRLTWEDPSRRAVVRAVRAGISIYSPHTALDAAAGGVNDWLADALPAGERRPLRPCPEDPARGQGREVELSRPLGLPTVIRRLKDHLGRRTLRVARPPTAGASPRVRRVAFCAGAGSYVLQDTGEADLWVTGEMRHHEVLAALDRGITVVLAEHSSSERGYLPILSRRLAAALDGRVRVRISARDREPLELA